MTLTVVSCDGHALREDSAREHPHNAQTCTRRTKAAHLAGSSEPASGEQVADRVRHRDRKGREQQDEVEVKDEGEGVVLDAQEFGDDVPIRLRTLLGVEVHVRVLLPSSVLALDKGPLLWPFYVGHHWRGRRSAKRRLAHLQTCRRLQGSDRSE